MYVIMYALKMSIKLSSSEAFPLIAVAARAVVDVTG